MRNKKITALSQEVQNQMLGNLSKFYSKQFKESIALSLQRKSKEKATKNINKKKIKVSITIE